MKLVLHFLYLFVIVCNRADEPSPEEDLLWLSESRHIGPKHMEVLNLAIENVRRTGKHKPDIPYEPVGRITHVYKASAEEEDWYEMAYEVTPSGNICHARFNIKGAASWKNVHFQGFRCMKRSHFKWN
uniref:Uncharacterized protein n=1 Tax=Lygus hesperus TaxID=30085 RepID=A0A0K8S5W1_LYGHE